MPKFSAAFVPKSRRREKRKDMMKMSRKEGFIHPSVASTWIMQAVR